MTGNGGDLTVVGDAGDRAVLTCQAGQAAIVGGQVLGDKVTCEELRTVALQGAQVLELDDIHGTVFPNLEMIRYLDPDGVETRRLLRSGPEAALPLWVEAPTPSGPSPDYETEAQILNKGLRLPGDGFPALSPSVSALTTTVEAANYVTNITHTGFAFIPPDPIAAAGPNHLVNVVNVSIEWYDKATGTQQNTQDLASFFSSLSPSTFTFDPKVIYDQYNDRFVVITLERTNSPNTSWIYVAVSDDSNPNGTWYFQAINSKVSISMVEHWADYPGLAVDDQAIYITNNMFPFGGNTSSGVRLWIIDKGQGSGGLYDGGTSTVNIYDPDAASGTPAPTSFTLQPAHMFGTAPGNLGTFLVMTGLSADPSGGSDEFLRIIRVDNPITTTTFTHQFINVGDIDNFNPTMPDAPQLGSAQLIETNDRRALNAVWRGNNLWTTSQILPAAGNDAGEATAHWFRVDTTSLASLALADQGSVGGSDIHIDAYTFMPSVMADQSGNMALGFALSSPAHYPGAYYTCRLASDPAGTVQSTGALAAGQDFYYRTFSDVQNRWGDYSGMALDPANEDTFWVYNEYAISRGNISNGNQDGRWGTRYGNFACVSAVTPLSPAAYLPALTKNHIATGTVANGDFESGNASWTQSSAGGFPLIYHKNDPGAPVGVSPHGGDYLAWLGGANDEHSVLGQQVTVPTGDHVLQFWAYIQSNDTCNFDFARVQVNNTDVAVYDLCASTHMTAWASKTVDLGAYGGQTVLLEFEVSTDFVSVSNFFVDDISFVSP